jgi:hypothetical protein
MKMFVVILILLASPVLAQNPQLSETEQLKIQILNLQYALKAEQTKLATLTTLYGQCQSTLLKDSSELDKATSDLQQKINDQHEGFRFDIRTGQFTKKEPVEKK